MRTLQLDISLNNTRRQIRVSALSRTQRSLPLQETGPRTFGRRRAFVSARMLQFQIRVVAQAVESTVSYRLVSSRDRPPSSPRTENSKKQPVVVVLIHPTFQRVRSRFLRSAKRQNQKSPLEEILKINR